MSAVPPPPNMPCLIVFVALAIAVGAQAFSNGLNTLFRSVSTTLTGITIPDPLGAGAVAVGNGMRRFRPAASV